MRLTETTLEGVALPPSFADYVKDAQVYDSSCGENATVWYLSTGLFLKRVPSARGSLGPEAVMTRHMHGLGLAPRVVLYDALPDYDFMLTEAVPGKDCTDAALLAQPVRLAEALALHLRALHGVTTVGCPRPARMDEMLALAERCYSQGIYSQSMLDYIGVPDRGEALRRMRELKPLAKQDTLIHGDYCLPNVLLNDDYSLSRFIDWDYGGVGDHHFDLFWGVWSLGYNLKTYAYTDVFLDAYGRESFDPNRMLLCGLISALT